MRERKPDINIEVENLLQQIKEIKTNDDLLKLLDNDPPSVWVKTHPNIPGHKFLPIDKVEFLLRQIFKLNYRIEVLSTSTLFNAASVTARVHYREFDAPNNWLSHDGTGADAPTLTENNRYTPYSVSAALPTAKTLAIKDACDHFGRLFGSDLNRANTIPKENTKLSTDQLHDEISAMFIEVEAKIPSDKFVHYKRIIDRKETNSYTKLYASLSLLKKI